MTSAMKIPRDQIEALRPGDVRLYLSSRGWVAVPETSPSPRAVEFHNESHPDVELLLPLVRNVGDFALRMADLVVALASVENRSAWDVLKDLSGTPGDVLRLRVATPDATLGNLPLEEGIQLLRGARDLLVAAASSTLHPKALHPQKLDKQVRNYVRNCRLGQTERGSFVATIVSPVDPEIQTSMDFNDDQFRLETEPYSRRVTTRLMSTLGVVSNAIQRGQLFEVAQAVEEGVSANLCEALKMMRPPGEQSQLDISVTWARTRSHIPENVPQSVSFPQESFGLIDDATRKLRSFAYARSKKYEGSIIAVQKMKRTLFPDQGGRVVISTIVRGEAAKLRVDLNQDDFRRACEALRDGKNIAFSGLIRSDVKTREYELSEPTDFETIDPS
jgi:hypothetical protein